MRHSFNPIYLMLAILLPLLLSAFPCFSRSLDERDSVRIHQVGLSVSGFGENAFIPFVPLIGAPSYEDAGHYSISALYYRSYRSWFQLGTGLTYTVQSLYIHPNLGPMEDVASRKIGISIVSVPVGIRLTAAKYLYLETGAQLGFQVHQSEEIDSQTGLGAYSGAGLQYPFKAGFTIFLNAFIKAHALVPFLPDGAHHRLLETGITLGACMNLSGRR